MTGPEGAAPWADRPAWIFFDVGSTLTDETQPLARIVDTLAAAYAAQGMPYTQEVICGAMADASRQYKPPVRAAVERLSRDTRQYAEMMARAAYDPELEELYPEAPALLKHLAGRCRLGVIANQSAGGQERLARHGIRKYFTVLSFSAEVGYAKPDERLFFHALRAAGCEPGEAVYVGDRLDNDIEPAKRLGLRTVRVLQGLGALQTEKDARYAPDVTILTLLELARYI